MNLTTYLKRLGACLQAVEWAKLYATLAEAWAACNRGDWMLWLAAKGKLTTRQEVVLAACACARLALPHVRPGEMRPLAAIETAERWARGEATLAELRSAARSAAYAAAAYAAARKATLKQCADIVRDQAKRGGWEPK